MNVPPPPPPPFASPTPHRIQSDMAHNLENFSTPPPPPPGSISSPPPPMFPQANFNYNPGFSPPPPRNNSEWSPWAAPPPQNSNRSYSTSPLPDPYAPAPPPLHQSMSNLSIQSTSSLSSNSSLTAPLPTTQSLLSALSSIHSSPPETQLTWIRDILFLIDKNAATAAAQTSLYGSPPSNDPPVGPVTISDPDLPNLSSHAIPLLLTLASSPSPLPEALFHRACITASGAFPAQIKQNPRAAFRDFESSARGGYPRAWYRIGRDYESFGDVTRARECFERGVSKGEPGCMYRMGMACLLGQLGLPANMERAMSLLRGAASASSLDAPQPAYVYALLLLGEFTQATVPPHLLPPPTQAQAEAKIHLEKSAFLHFPPAQYKLGHAYEFAVPPWEFDSLMSVEWYSRASQNGEVEADMALSKWFLCGSAVEGKKDESLARIFAEKAARRGLPSAEFAMGYYSEVGVGGVKDLAEARAWYEKAAAHGNTDAQDRLSALAQSQHLTRAEHDTITESKLVRSRTQAKERSEAQRIRDGYLAKTGGQPQPGPQPGFPQPHPQQQHPPRRDSKQVVELIRKNTLGSRPPIPPQQPSAHGRYATEPQPYPPQQARPPSAGGPHQQQAPYNGPGVGLRPQQHQQAFPSANRYTLTDPGSGSAPPGSGRTTSPMQGGPVPPGRRVTSGPGSQTPPQGPSQQPPPQNQSRPTSSAGGASKKPGPQTFAEMGFTGAKAEDKDCVIM
ncbi:chitin synthase activator [Moniliophthora roreri MCA 2997]|uniref:Chitin synthase activator n=2 Tax=Moniliophthora roreri TaxID=221103 RepID=V2XHJ4_MONRO|nr:chitin synthase activator [Moniliophthora roreri MCA 2997]